jgi:iron-sulfur cluster assembly accessory protein
MTATGTTSILTITDAALAKIREVMAQQDLQADEKNLRIFVDGGGGCCGGGPSFGLAFDRAQEGDAKFEQSGMQVVVDPASLPFCTGATVDWVEQGDVQGFKVDAPAMKAMREQQAGGCSSGGCGCGSGGCGDAHGSDAHSSADAHGHSHAAKKSGGGCCGG